MIYLECPFCAARLEIGEDRAGRSMTCPFCKGQVEVPKPHAPRRHPRYQREYDLEEDNARPHGALASGGMLTEADIAALEEEEAPRKKKRRPKMEWRLFVGGFGFPWTQGAVMRWLLLGLWATVAGWLGYTAFALGIGQALDEGNMVETIVAVIAAVAATAAGICCFAVAAIHGLTILLETTAGNDRMESWPNVILFLDWVHDLWFIFNTAALSLTLGLGIGWLLPGLFGGREATVAATVFFVFPILLLCTLETDSAFLPVSPVVFASLGKHGIAWLAFYLQAVGLLAAAVFVYYPVWQLQPSLAIPLTALLFAAVVMIYFRLLGRLAFYCSVEPEPEEVEE